MRKPALCHMPTTKAQISLISAFVVRCLDSRISLVSTFAISSSVAEQANLSLTWSQTAKTRLRGSLTNNNTDLSNLFFSELRPETHILVFGLRLQSVTQAGCSL